ncbi:CubicO group peptidase, beta-lactamase class C family [Halapricum desulfuricans]|uniref:CubicO group peptidase, beta-lactamase class C family n=1 Tax=Halapricum desulfuricans TaxID=2841257 RepID=A0A897NE57_9EURY|nr:serine hydrolase domain-containing protein [Halapricum desulfuricans]QSG10661.1 CubicO group peptidase, beta-lactamase class C family [Halapricum desulfuricans]
MKSITESDHEQLRAAFDRQLAVGLHHGAQLAVYVDGELVVDFAGGTTGPEGEETTSETRHLLFSCTKPYAGVGLHQLIEDGKAEYDDPVVQHWPGFADPGTRKADITIRHVLSHTAGIPYGEFDEQSEKWSDWDAVVQAMEDIEPVFEPGKQPAYHTFNYGWLVGELIRCLSGQPVEEYVAEHVFDPLGMARTSIGLAPDTDDVATLTGFEVFDRCCDPGEGLGIPASESAAAFNDEGVQSAVVPAATGIGTARDMARFYAAMANGGELDGTRLLEETTVAEATRTHAETDSDGTLSRPARYGLGFWIGGLANDMFGSLSRERMFGHAGLGSVFGWGDPELNVGFAYVTNGIREESWEHAARVAGLSDAVRLALLE